MSGINKVILIGRIGKEPEVRYMPNGEAVANISIATSETWKDQSGEKKERTEWTNLVFYRKLAEIVGEYVHKGAPLYVEGKLRTRKWQDGDGKDRYATEVIVEKMEMLGSKSGSDRQDGVAPGAQSSTSDRQKDNFDHFDDDIPF